MDSTMERQISFFSLDPFDTELYWNISTCTYRTGVVVQSANNNVAKKLMKIPTAVCDTSPCSPTSMPDYTLVQAQIILRHGARTPLFTIPNVPEARYDKRIFKARLAHTDFDFELHHVSGSKADGFHESPVNKRYNKRLLGGMLIGQLTTLGQQQCFERGLQLRRRYITKYKLISGQIDDSVYMRSTHIARTIDSLRSFVAGMFGVETLHKTTPKFHVAYYNEETLYPSVLMCDCLRDIATHGKKERINTFPDIAELSAKICKSLSYESSRPLGMIALRDDLVAREAHSQIIPPELEPYFDAIDKQAAIEFVQDILGTNEDRSLGLLLAVGPFHHSLLNKMDSAVKGNRPAKLSIYSSHDSMVMPLLVALGNYNCVWPPYASYIAYELWQHNVNQTHHVKVIYNGKELTLPGKSSSLITYPEFQEFLSPITISVPEWKKLCSQPKASIDSPDIEYSLHYDGGRAEDCEDDNDTVASGM